MIQRLSIEKKALFHLKSLESCIPSWYRGRAIHSCGLNNLNIDSFITFIDELPASDMILRLLLIQNRFVNFKSLESCIPSLYRGRDFLSNDLIPAFWRRITSIRHDFTSFNDIKSLFQLKSLDSCFPSWYRRRDFHSYE